MSPLDIHFLDANHWKYVNTIHEIYLVVSDNWRVNIGLGYGSWSRMSAADYRPQIRA